MKRPGLLFVLCLVQTAAACQSPVWQAAFIAPRKYAQLEKDAPFLKVHTHDGSVYVLRDWTVVESRKAIEGLGILYDERRKVVKTGSLSAPFDAVALLETNRPETVTHYGKFVVMGVVTAVALSATVALCASKGCFGSCPTFYADDGEHEALQAEGFSDSVARVLEDTDVDALFTAKTAGGDFRLTMRNEAPETHLVRSLRVLTVPRPPGGRVFRAGDRYYPAAVIHAPLACAAAEGDCLDRVRAFDLREYRSSVDEHDLAAREIVELRFPPAAGGAGLVIGARNTLVNTFLIYQLLAYMGRSAGDWFMKLEHASRQELEKARGFGHLMGWIDAEVWHPQRGWLPIGRFVEVGPIARDVQMVTLPPDLPPGEVRIRLKMARGNWRLDYVALAELGAPVAPIAIAPGRVESHGADDPEALARLRDPDAYLYTYQGDAYTVHFALPAGSQELFLESRGYYYEWMRADWLREEDAAKVVELVFHPDQALRRLAPLYRRMESALEVNFWRSKVGQ